MAPKSSSKDEIEIGRHKSIDEPDLISSYAANICDRSAIVGYSLSMGLTLSLLMEPRPERVWQLVSGIGEGLSLDI